MGTETHRAKKGDASRWPISATECPHIARCCDATVVIPQMARYFLREVQDEKDQQGFPKRGIFMKRPNLRIPRAFYTVVSQRFLQKSP